MTDFQQKKIHHKSQWASEADILISCHHFDLQLLCKGHDKSLSPAFYLRSLYESVEKFPVASVRLLPFLKVCKMLQGIARKKKREKATLATAFRTFGTEGWWNHMEFISQSPCWNWKRTFWPNWSQLRRSLDVGIPALDNFGITLIHSSGGTQSW